MRSNAPNLMVVRGHDTGRQVPVDERSPITIGRGDGCTFQLHDPSVSRVHCKISMQGRQLVISDEGSRWGIQVNGQAAPIPPVSRVAFVSLRANSWMVKLPTN